MLQVKICPRKKYFVLRRRRQLSERVREGRQRNEARHEQAGRSCPPKLVDDDLRHEDERRE